MDFGRAFTHATQDPEWWKKIGIAGLLMFIPIIGWFAVLGWGLEITRRVINNDPGTLPDWSNFMDHLVRGLKGFVVSLVFSLPGDIINICRGSINAIITNPDLMRNMDSNLIGMLSTANNVFAICCGCLGAILAIAGAFLIPAAYGNMMANNGDLGAAFRFNELIALIRAGIGPYLMAFLGTIIVSIIIPFGLIACFIGVFFTAAWGTTVTSHLYGQAYNAAKSAQLASPVVSAM
jgi:hypothetical protein